MNEQVTKDWKLYESGITYNQRLMGSDRNYYNVIDTNIAFASGDQWRNVVADGLPKPVFNIIKRVKQFKIASLKSDNIAITMRPMEYRPQTEERTMQQKVDIVDLANEEIKNILKDVDYDGLTRRLLSDAFDTGDFCLHWYFDKDVVPFKKKAPNVKGVIKCEIIDSTNVIFGNPNTRIVEKQPYIIVVGRDIVNNLKEEAKLNKSQDWQKITSDNETNYQMGDNGKIESEADDFKKALYIIKYYRGKDGKIYANKSTKGAYIYQNKKTDLSRYPIAFNNWEEVKGTYHGRAETTGIIPNQIAINKMFAMVIYHLMLTAFPTAVYDADRIESWSNAIGEAIPITNLQNSSIHNVAGYLEPATMSGQIMNAIELAMSYTKECLGVGDVSLGNVTMNNATAIIAIQKSAAVPLENVKAALYEFTKDCGNIILDMMSTYYGTRPVVITDGLNKEVSELNFDLLKDIWYTIETDVGESSYYSEIASLQTLDNLLNNGMIEFIDYLKRIPSNVIPQKQELITKIEQSDMYKQAIYNLMGQYIDGLPQEERANLMQLSPEMMEQKVLEMMGALDNGNQGANQINDMEQDGQMEIGDTGFQKIMTDSVDVGRNDAAAIQKIEEI